MLDAFYRFLAARGARVPAALLERDVRAPTAPCEPLQDELLRLYGQPELVILFELMTDFDEGFLAPSGLRPLRKIRDCSLP